jgi:hypothetical protein
MVNIIVLRSSNVVRDANQNRLKWVFPGSGVTFRNNKIALLKATLYNSMYNINSNRYNNNTFSYVWLDGVTYTVSIPDGFYAVTDLNLYLRYVMDQHKHYLVDTSTNNPNPSPSDPNDIYLHKYLMEIVTNDVYYGIQVNFTAYSTNSSSHYSVPTGATWSLSSSLKCPQLVIGPNNFKLLLGLNSGTYPSVNTASSYVLSQYTPQISPISSIIVRCDLIRSQYGNPCDILHGIAINADYAKMIVSENANASYVDIRDGPCSEFYVTFQDQDLNDIAIRDTSLIVILGIQ